MHKLLPYYDASCTYGVACCIAYVHLHHVNRRVKGLRSTAHLRLLCCKCDWRTSTRAKTSCATLARAYRCTGCNRKAKCEQAVTTSGGASATVPGWSTMRLDATVAFLPPNIYVCMYHLNSGRLLTCTRMYSFSKLHNVQLCWLYLLSLHK